MDPGPSTERFRHRAELRQAIEEIVGFNRALRQHFRQRLAQVGVFGRQRCEPGRTLRRREIERRIEQRAQSFPVGSSDRHVRFIYRRNDASNPDIQRSMARQQQPRLLPVTPDRAIGDSERGGDLGFGHPGEITHFDHLHQSRILVLQRLDGIVDLDDFVFPGAQVFGELRVERQVHGVTAAPLRLALAREIDDDRTHDARRIGKEVPALGAREFAGTLEAQEALVQQHRGIQQRVAPAAAQLRARLAAQVFIGHGEQALARCFVAGVRALDQ